MSKAIYDPVAFTRLTDQVLQQIQLSSDPKMKPVLKLYLSCYIVCDPQSVANQAKDILKKMERRELYKFVGQTQALTDLTQVSYIERTISC